MCEEWDEFVDDAPDDLDVEISFADMRLAALKAARATRELSETAKKVADVFRVAADQAVLSSEVIDEQVGFVHTSKTPYRGSKRRE